MGDQYVYTKQVNMQTIVQYKSTNMKYELIKLVILTLCLNKLIKNIHKLLIDKIFKTGPFDYHL